MNHEPAGSRQTCVAQQKNTLLEAKILSRNTTLLPRSVYSPQRHFWPRTMLPTDAVLQAGRGSCL